jgi:hypothetical protein
MLAFGRLTARVVGIRARRHLVVTLGIDTALPVFRSYNVKSTAQPRLVS